MIIAFAGSRNFTDEHLVYRVLNRLKEIHGNGLILSFGDAEDGLDAFVWKWAKTHLPRERYIRHICHWPPRGADRQEIWMATHDRNGRVIRRAEELVAFYGVTGVSGGTRDAIDQARAAGIPVKVYNQFGGMWS